MISEVKREMIRVIDYYQMIIAKKPAILWKRQLQKYHAAEEINSRENRPTQK